MAKHDKYDWLFWRFMCCTTAFLSFTLESGIYQIYIYINLATTAVSFHWKMNSHKMIRNRKYWTDNRQALVTKKSSSQKEETAKMCLCVIPYFFMLYTFARMRTWELFKAFSCRWCDVQRDLVCFWMLLNSFWAYDSCVFVLGQSLTCFDSKPWFTKPVKEKQKAVWLIALSR